MFEIIGVMTPNVQLTCTWTVSPMSLVAVPVGVGEGGCRDLGHAGDLRQLAVRGRRISEDLVLVLRLDRRVRRGAPGLRVVRGEVGRDARHVLQVDVSEIHATEVERGEGHQKEDRQHQRELDEALAPRTARATGNPKTYGQGGRTDEIEACHQGLSGAGVWVMTEYSASSLTPSLETLPECIARKGQQGYPMVIR